MKNRFEIELDYRNALQKADKLDALSETICRLKNGTLQEAEYEVGNCWKGDNAEAFLQRSRMLGEEFLQQAWQLRRIASVIRTIAGNTYRAEKHALELAEKRTYGN